MYNKRVISPSVSLFIEGAAFENGEQPTREQLHEIGQNILDAVARQIGEVGVLPDDMDASTTEVQVVIGGKRLTQMVNGSEKRKVAEHKWSKTPAQIVWEISDEFDLEWDDGTDAEVAASFIENNCDEADFIAYVRKQAQAEVDIVNGTDTDAFDEDEDMEEEYE